MSWFKKVENKNKWVEVPDKVEELKETIENMKKESSEREDEFKEEIEKLHRIIKFASDEPTFRFERKYQHGWRSSSISNILSIYIE